MSTKKNDPWVNYTGTLTENRKNTRDALQNAYEYDLDAYEEGYKADVADLNESKSLAVQEANINHELLMKYLPELNRQNGLYGLGVSQSANAEALANYQNNLTEINRNYNRSMDSLNRGKTEYEAGLKRTLNSDLLSLYAEQERENREDALSAYADAQDMITAGVGTMTRSDVDQYIDGLSLDKATKDKLGALANYLYGEDTGESKGKTFTASTKVSDGEVKVSVGGVIRNLMLGEPAVPIPTKVSGDYKDDEAFVYDNGIYVKKNGQVYQVFDENGGMTSEYYSDLYTYLHTGKEKQQDASVIKGLGSDAAREEKFAKKQREQQSPSQGTYQKIMEKANSKSEPKATLTNGEHTIFIDKKTGQVYKIKNTK